jgi:Tfp pilus assembly pilus retraction ATPase PilT
MHEELSLHMYFVELLKTLGEVGVSDVYVSPTSPVKVRYLGQVMTLSKALDEMAKNVDPVITQGLNAIPNKLNLREGFGSYEFSLRILSYVANQIALLPNYVDLYLKPLIQNGAVDIGMALNEGYRVRVHGFVNGGYLREALDVVFEGAEDEEVARKKLSQAFSYVTLVMRIVPPPEPRLEGLGLAPTVGNEILSTKGLYLITGPTASGKTTTLSSLLLRAAMTKPWHIISLEDPIEYYLYLDPTKYPGLVHQRERGRDFPEFKHALFQALRESPDLIAVGEVRDRETLEWVLYLAEAGFLVLATYHTSTFRETIHRIVHSFEGGEREVTKARLMGTLKGVLSQRLIPTSKGLRLVYEFHSLRDGGAQKIEAALKGTTPSTELSWSKSLRALVAQGELSEAEALNYEAMLSGGGPTSVYFPDSSGGRR